MIVGMTQSHVDSIRQGFGLRAMTLGRLAGGMGDIADPFGGQDAEYELSLIHILTPADVWTASRSVTACNCWSPGGELSAAGVYL